MTHNFSRAVSWEDSPVSRGAHDFALPAGTVTLLLADIEGSTETRSVPVRHDEIVGETIAAHSGVRPAEQGEGNGFIAAFARATDAVAAALEIQRHLATERAVVSLRVGIHTGEVRLNDNANYIGETVNRAGRLRDAAHGGQVVLSQSSRELVVDRLPADATLEDLGTHRLRDLARPERVYQLCHPELRRTFPALRSLDRHRHNLPIQLTSFVGREAEMTVVKKLIGESRILTLTGSGGCGKTRLALQVAGEEVERFVDGVFLVDLTPIADGGAVAKSIADVLGLVDEPMTPIIRTLTAWLREREILLLLDNCEHLVAACADVVDQILRSCEHVHVLATSREPLGVHGEVPWRVPSLSCPGVDAPPRIDSVTQYEAVRLFIDRAKQVRPNFAVTEDSAAAIAEICHRLDGIPHAIELAAARTRVLMPEQICDGLHDRFRFLTGGARTVVPRQQTLHASVDWSHELLSEHERTVFRRLSVFVDGFTLDMAEAVASGDGIEPLEVLDLVSGLVDRSLVHVEERLYGLRYRMLETIRQYAADRLHQSGDEPATRKRVVGLFGEHSAAALRHVYAVDRDEWLQRVADEHRNGLVAWAWSLEAGDVDAAIAITEIGLEFGRSGGMTDISAVDIRARWQTLRDNDLTARQRGCIVFLGATKLSDLHEALALFREAGDDKWAARMLFYLGQTTQLFDPGAARSLYEEAVGLARRSGDIKTLVESLSGLGYIPNMWGRPSEALPLLEEALREQRRIGFRTWELQNSPVPWLLIARTYAGEVGDAVELADAFEAESRGAGHRFNLALALYFGGLIRALVGEYDIAVAQCEEAIEIAHELSPILEGSAACVTGLARSLAGMSGNVPMLEASLGMMAPNGPTWQCLGRAMAAHAAHLEGANAPARTWAEEALRITDEHPQMTMYRGFALLVLARLARSEDDLERAEQQAHAALELLRNESQWFTIDALEHLGALCAEAEAARLLGAASAARERVNYARAVPERAPHDALVAELRASIGDAAFEAAWDEGRTLSLAEAVAYAQRGRGQRRRPPSGWASLTPMELEVVKLVREGLTNPKIAERLFVSRSTIKSHLSQVFAKVGVSSRTELASEATRRNV